MGEPMLTLGFRVEGDVYAAFSPNKYISSWEKRRRVQRWRERVWGEWYQAGANPVPTPVQVTIWVYRAREVDFDNLMASAKSLLDGLTAKKRGPMMQACLPDDSRQTILDLRVDGVFDKKWKGKEWVYIQIAALTGSPRGDGGRPRPLDGEDAPAHPAAVDRERPHPGSDAR